jgi:hypothetical protein
MRTITYLTSAPSGVSEQLVLYRDARSAQAAFRKLRVDLARCSKPAVVKRDQFGYVGKPLRVGDEGLSVAGYDYDAHGRRLAQSDDLAVVGRRGAALFPLHRQRQGPRSEEGDHRSGQKNGEKGMWPSQGVRQEDRLTLRWLFNPCPRWDVPCLLAECLPSSDGIR